MYVHVCGGVWWYVVVWWCGVCVLCRMKMNIYFKAL